MYLASISQGNLPPYGEVKSLLLGGRCNLGFYMEREEFIGRLGFSLVTQEIVDYIVGYRRPVLSIGCGSGFVEHVLTQSGCMVVATDNYARQYSREWEPGFISIENISAQDAVCKYHGYDVFVSWPCYAEQWAYEAAKNMKVGNYLYYIGEGYGGCTADDDFHDLLYTDFVLQENTPSLPQFSGLHDEFFHYIKVK
jgi:hypothetical protein